MSQSLGTKITEDDRLRQIAHHTPGVIYQARMRPDGSFHFPYASDGLQEVHGTSPAEVSEDASQLFSVIHPEDIDRVTQSILESAANMTPWYCEYRVNLPHERQLWLVGHSTPQREADGSTLWHGYIRDITVSKTTEFALQTSESKFRSIIENLNDMVYIIKADASFSYVSPQFQEVMGYELAEFMNNSFANWVHPEDMPICVDALQRSFQGEKVRGIEYRALHKDGNYYWHSSNVSALRDEEGEVVACLGIARDITDRKAAEKSLQETNNFLHSVLETIPDFFFAKDLEGRHIVVNSNLAQFFGKPVADMIGKTDAELLPPDIAEKIMTKDWEIMTTGITERFEEVVPTDGAANTYYLTVKTPLLNAQGDITGLIGIAQNITDRKQAELKNQQTQNFLSSIIENIPHMVFVKDAENLQFLRLNKAGEELLGYPRETLLGKSDYDFFSPEEAAFFVAKDREVLASGTVIDISEEPIQTNHQGTRILHTRKIPILDEFGRPQYLLGISEDITDRKQAQKEQSRLLAILEATSDFVGSADPSGNVLYLNRSARQMLGLTPTDDISQRSLTESHPEWANQLIFSEGLPETGRSGSWLGETAILKADGNEIPVSQLIVSHRSEESGEIEYFSTIARDISEQKAALRERQAAEAALKVSENNLRTIFDNSNNAIFIHDIDTTILDVNNRMLEMFGMESREAALALSVIDYSASDAPLDQVPIFWERALAGETVRFEWKCQHPKDGSCFDSEITINKIVLDGKEVMLSSVLDISEQQAALRERKLTEAALAESEAQNRAILQSIPDIMFRVNESGIYLSYSTSATLFDLGSQQPIGTFMGDYLSPEHYQRHKRHMEIALETRQIQVYEQEIEIAGRIQQEEVRIVPIEGKQEVLFMIRDIGDRKQAEAALAESEAQNRAILQAIPDLIFRVNRDGIYLSYSDSSKSTELLNSFGNQQALGKPMMNYLPPENYQLQRHYMEMALATKHIQIYEQEVVIDGQVQQEEVRVVPLEDREEVLFIMRDISDRKAAEAALSEYADRQTLLNQLIHQIRNSLDLDAVISTTIQSIRDLLDIDACNFAWYIPNVEPPIWEVIQESKLEDIPSSLGCYAPTFVGPVDQLLFNQEILRIDDAAQYPEPIHRAFLDTIHCQSEILLPIKTHSHQIGVIICIHYRQVRPWKDSEIELLRAISNQLAIAIDQAELYAESRTKSQELQNTLQELQRTQTQMIQSEKMSSLGQLVAGIAHEINNPVSFIYGNIQPATTYVEELTELVYLYQKYYPEPPQIISKRLEEIDIPYLVHDFYRLLESMKNGAARIRDIIKSLRTFSRLDEEGCKEIDIHENIDSTLMVLQSRFNGRDGKPEVQLIKNYGDLPWVECYGGLLNQVFVNLLTNAIDAIEQQRNILESTQDVKYQGVITITTSLTVTNQVVISIRDNGCGMDAQLQEKIFNPFFTTKPIGQGTGMGLAISYQIMTENHQGNIFVNSTPGEGTEFVMTMPIKQNSELAIIEEFLSCAIDHEK